MFDSLHKYFIAVSRTLYHPHLCRKNSTLHLFLVPVKRKVEENKVSKLVGAALTISMMKTDLQTKEGVRILLLFVLVYLLSLCDLYVKAVSLDEDLSLTAGQKAVLDKFKVQMIPVVPHDYMKQDIYLIRWLRAKNFNMRQAAEMLKENLHWRKQAKMDTINQEDWSDMKDDFEYTTDTFDLEGRPVSTFNIATWNFRRMALTGKMPRLIRYMDKLLEEGSQAVLTLQGMGRNVTQWKVIMNMDGFNVVQHACPLCLPGYLTFVQSFENHYPGSADALILINTPPAFQVVLELVRPVFTEPTRRALKIFGIDKARWMEYLDKEVAREQRRPEFGGTRKD